MLPAPSWLYIPTPFGLFLHVKACHTRVWLGPLSWVQGKNLAKLLRDSVKLRGYLYLGGHDKNLTHFQLLCEHSFRNKVDLHCDYYCFRPRFSKALKHWLQKNLKICQTCATIFYWSGSLVILYVLEKTDRNRFYLAIKALKCYLVI